MSTESELKSQLLKQPDDKRYFNREETLKLLETVPIPTDDENKSESGNPPGVVNYVVDFGDRLIDLNPADNGNNYTQDYWINYFNEHFNEQRRDMISTREIYLIGKSNNQQLSESLRTDFRQLYVVTSTRIVYNKNELDGTIVHYFGSTVTKPLQSGLIHIPHYAGNKLTNVLCEKAGLKYLQELFGTTDNADQIKQSLENLSGHTSNNIEVSTPRPDLRESLSLNAPFFDCDNRGCRIIGHFDINRLGLSRGVMLATKNTGGSQ